MKSVVRGSRRRRVCPMCAPSTLETKWSRGPPAEYRLERRGRHRGPEIGAADADVHDVRHTGIGVPRPGPFPNGVTERAHVIECRLDVGHDVTALHQDWSPAAIAKGGVQHGAPFGVVDRLSREHPIAIGFHADGARQAREQAHRVGIDVVLGVVHHQVVEAQREVLRTLRIVLEQLGQVTRLPPRRRVRMQRLPRRGHGPLVGPDAEPAFEGAVVVAEPDAWRQLGEEAHVPAAEDDVLGRHGRAEQFRGLEDHSLPLRFAELAQAVLAGVVLERLVPEGEMRQLQCHQPSIVNQGGAETRAEPEEQHPAAFVAPERLHCGVVDDPRRDAELAFVIEAHPAATEVPRFLHDRAPEDRAGDADGGDVERPVGGVLPDARDELLRGEAIARIELPRLGAGDDQLDVGAADVDHQDAHGTRIVYGCGQVRAGADRCGQVRAGAGGCRQVRAGAAVRAGAGGCGRVPTGAVRCHASAAARTRGQPTLASTDTRLDGHEAHGSFVRSVLSVTARRVTGWPRGMVAADA